MPDTKLINSNEPIEAETPEAAETAATAENLNIIEKELDQLISDDKKSWIKIYRLLETVETQRLYTTNYRSFTAWINSLSTKLKIHVSVLWSRKKAGKIYSEYLSRAHAAGRSVTTLDDTAAPSIPPESINYIDKIAGSNTAVADDLMDKLLNGNLSRNQLKSAWETVKAGRAATGIKPRVNAHDAYKDAVSDATSTNNEKQITAADIVLALTTSSEWLSHIGIGTDASTASPIIPNLTNHRSDRPDRHVTPKYRVMPEFAVRTGTSHFARRIDALVLENHTIEQLRDKNYELHLHAVEIKVDRHDLLGDHKMQEYCDFADFFWIAVPAVLEEDARSILAPGWGLLVITDDADSKRFSRSVRVAEKAKMSSGVMRDQTLSTALIKLL
ncbi:hypothetical protein [Hominenteromicrobium sp.]|uniref:hypothetical protein n=1 Tax=Hominenteromicrobium sp. TaxID=3073581 RepID=UPI003A8F6FD8